MPENLSPKLKVKKEWEKEKGTHFVGNLLEELFFVELYKVARFLPVSVLQGTNQSGGP